MPKVRRGRFTPKPRDRKKKTGGASIGNRIVTLKEAIGTKGAPYSIGNAVIATNPHYSADYKEYSYNCQRCVVAYEMRRRGYDVEAQATTGDYDPLATVAYKKGDVYMGRWRGAFRHAVTESVGARGNNAQAEQKVMDNIASKMRQWGDGSRAVIQIFYRSGGGHVFNVENQGGRIVYVEAQAGKIKDMARTMKSVDTNSVNIVRVDNLKVSDRMKRFVMKRGTL